MSDYERYGDYNEIDDDLPKSKNIVLIILKILVFSICAGVVLILGVRMFLFSTYPKSVSSVYPSEAFLEYYRDTNGDVELKTQDLRAPYSDNTKGYFFCDCLILAEKIGEVQVTVRYNKASLGYIGEELSITLPDEVGNFKYKLTDNLGRSYEPSASSFDTRAMYRYEKLVFDGVDFSIDENDEVKWMRLEVFIGDTAEPYAMVAVYENNDQYARFDNYKLSKGEAW